MTSTSLTWIILLLLAFAAWRDLMTRTIPDFVSIAILILGLILRAFDGPAAIGISLAIGVALFLLLLPLHARGLMGGADLKLLSALVAGMSPLASYRLVSFVAILGGVLAVVYLGLQYLTANRTPTAVASGRASVARRLLAVELWRIRKGAALPYGIAIAAGATVLSLGSTGV